MKRLVRLGLALLFSAFALVIWSLLCPATHTMLMAMTYRQRGEIFLFAALVDAAFDASKKLTEKIFE